MGDLIYYQVRARNSVGWGDWNTPQLHGQRVITKPDHPVAPIISNLGKDGFRVCWTAPAGMTSLASIRKNYQFFLHHNEGKGGIQI
jgi:hypothetical protein